MIRERFRQNHTLKYWNLAKSKPLKPTQVVRVLEDEHTLISYEYVMSASRCALWLILFARINKENVTYT